MEFKGEIMKEFTSIGAYRHTVTNVKHWCNKHAKPLPIIEYTGTVKIHGSNAGVRITENKVQPQSRNRIIDIDSDNYGFAAYCHSRKEFFVELAEKILQRPLKKNDDITIYGEWCGGTIQKNVGVSGLSKHYVIFSAFDSNNEKYISIDTFSPEDVVKYNKQLIYFINQVATYSITIDFSNPANSVKEMEDLTLSVEENCPWAKFMGSSGVGEGIVWVPNDKNLFEHSPLWFKTKGLEHKRTNVRSGNKIELDPVTVNTIKEFAENVLPSWRLEQGLEYLESNGMSIEPKNTGPYLKWICQDILKEETDVLCANNLTWKDVQGTICVSARQFYLKTVETRAMEKVEA